MTEDDGLLLILWFSGGFALGRAPEGGWQGWVVAGMLLALALRIFLRRRRRM